MAGLGATPSRPVGAEDIRDLQSRAGHPAPSRQAGGVMTRCSIGLLTSRMVRVATWE